MTLLLRRRPPPPTKGSARAQLRISNLYTISFQHSTTYATPLDIRTGRNSFHGHHFFVLNLLSNIIGKDLRWAEKENHATGFSSHVYLQLMEILFRRQLIREDWRDALLPSTLRLRVSFGYRCMEQSGSVVYSLLIVSADSCLFQ